jgi:hypothetical protein
LLVTEHSFEWVERGVGAQHEDAVELCLIFNPRRVDSEVLVADRFEIRPEASVTDQRLVAPGELTFQRRQDRAAIRGILVCVLVVAAKM